MPRRARIAVATTLITSSGAYVDLNPIRAKMVARPEHYLWSSCRARIGLIECEWLDPDPCFLALGSHTERRQERYREFVEQGITDCELKFIGDPV